MIFNAKGFDATWDTWLYYHNDIFYLYYLISEISPGEGFGVATSKDGVHFNDHGIQIAPSDKMVYYLGTGSVWIDPKDEKRFLCNYSEWRLDDEGKKRQNILFAWSYDLINWNKFGDDYIFRIDERYYNKYGRWDCINTYPRREGGYWGSWTATPIGMDDGGIGFVYSEDGLHWEALKPNDVRPDVAESGSFVEYEGSVYSMYGSGGMYAYKADSIIATYDQSPKNALLLKWGHSYFSRYFNCDGKILVNHHSMNGARLLNKRRYTYFAPIKEFSVDATGIQRWKYWLGNEALKGMTIDAYADLDIQKGLVFEYEINDNNLSNCFEFMIDKIGYKITIYPDGIIQFNAENAPEEWQMQHQANREIDFGIKRSVRILVRAGMLEAYINDFFLECWTMGCPEGKVMKLVNPKENLISWMMDIQ